LAKIESIRDLVLAKVSTNIQRQDKPAAVAVKRSAAADFLAKQGKISALHRSPTKRPQRKDYEARNNFINPQEQFKTPTLLREYGPEPRAHRDVAAAHVTISHTQVQCETKQPEKASRQSASFSRIPRTIENLLARAK